ncbi:helix-turn-helix domain-containing protein [Subtercola endophyticus]|uniref:helix-turn-helix domain-containing protein n=1 Tax=Subtercola endophyticus TaxID=2895559 RepID=UPI001E60699E|nr:helix-turn-helix domain-containing protein [Subtercola endophyticus]UFS58813.1 helix-turn-helix domain-containing protein [Subtercola endophyticus]
MVETVRSPAIPRAVAILEHVAQHGASTVSDISDRTGIARSSGSDLCSSLEQEHFLRRQPDGRLILGRALSQAATGFTAGIPIIDDFVATCDKIDDLAGVTVTFDALYCDEVLCLAVRHGRLNIPLTPRPGRRLALVSSSAGLALLAGISAADLRAHFDAFSGMLTNDDAGLAEISRTQSRLARSNGDLTMSNLRSERGAEIAYPITVGATLLGAVTATVPADQFDAEGVSRLAAAVRQAALAFQAIAEGITTPDAAAP